MTVYGACIIFLNHFSRGVGEHALTIAGLAILPIMKRLMKQNISFSI